MLRLTGTIVLDLRSGERPLRYQSAKLADAPDGVRVIIRVRDGQLPEYESIALVEPHLHRLGEIDVQADAETIRLWHEALRGVDPWQVAG